MEKLKGKTVRELIEELKQLDQDACVWQFYDFPCGCWPIEFEEVGGKAECFEGVGVKASDYAAIAG